MGRYLFSVRGLFFYCWIGLFLLEGVNVANGDRVDVCPCSSSCMDEINNHVM